MDEMKNWAFTICSGMLLCGAFSLLCPGKSFERIMRLILGLFLLLCFLTPVHLDFSGLELEASEAEELMDRVASGTDGYFFRAALEKSREAIEQIVFDRMEEYGIKPEDIQIYIEAEEGSPDGEGKNLIINIQLPESMRKNHELVYKALEYELGTEVRLEYREEDQE